MMSQPFYPGQEFPAAVGEGYPTPMNVAPLNSVPTPADYGPSMEQLQLAPAAASPQQQQQMFGPSGYDELEF